MILVCPDCWARLVQRGRRGLRAHQEFQVIQDYPAVKVESDSRANRAYLESQDNQVPQDLRELQEIRERKAQQVLMEFPVPLARKAIQVSREETCLDNQDIPDQRV